MMNVSLWGHFSSFQLVEILEISIAVQSMQTHAHPSKRHEWSLLTLLGARAFICTLPRVPQSVHRCPIMTHQQRDISSSTLQKMIQLSDTWHNASILFSKETWNLNRINRTLFSQHRAREHGSVQNNGSPMMTVNLGNTYQGMVRLVKCGSTLNTF